MSRSWAAIPWFAIRELERLIPQIESRVRTRQIVTSAFREIPAVVDEVQEIECRGIDRWPATGTRCPPRTSHLRAHPEEHQADESNRSLHNYIANRGAARLSRCFPRFLGTQPEVSKVWFSIFTPQRGATNPEILTPSQRRTSDCRSPKTAAQIPDPGHAGIIDTRDSLPAHQSGAVHLRQNHPDHLRRSSHTHHSMPVWRRPRLRAVWLYRVDGPGRSWPSPCRRAAYCRTPVYGFRPHRKTVEKSPAQSLAKTHR